MVQAKSREIQTRGEDESVVSLLNTKRVTPSGYVVDDDDHYRAYFKVRSDDLDALADFDKLTWMDSFAQMVRTYTGDMKLLTATTRVDTSSQQLYYRQHLIAAGRHLNKRLSGRELRYWQARQHLASEVVNRCENISRVVGDLNFYLIIFTETESAMKNATKLLLRSGGSTFRLQLVTGDDLKAINHRVANLCEE